LIDVQPADRKLATVAGERGSAPPQLVPRRQKDPDHAKAKVCQVIPFIDG
jgi:hypothetical protein